MPTVQLQAKDFSTREELETKIRQTTGESPEKKDNCTVQGTRGELRRLKLTDKTTVFGWRCVITDTPTESKKQNETVEKVDRGKIYKHGINLHG